MVNEMNGQAGGFSRRDFMKVSAAVSLGALSVSNKAFAAVSDTIGVGLIGCGSRGTGNAIACLESTEGVELVAMADIFQDKIDSSLIRLHKSATDKVKTTPETTFLGFDAYKKVLALPNVDVVMLTTPPGFRSEQLAAAVEAGKHIFMEKPVAVDPVGVRSVIASSEKAKEKNLSIVAGTQQRRMAHYIDLLNRIHGGEIGRIVSAQCHWDWGSQDWHFQKREAHWSDMEWQIRCWPYFTWLSGDHICEQHVHNLDIVNWAIGSHPVQCLAIGGRQVRTGPEYGNIFDHFGVEYEYPDGVRVLSMCSQIKGTTKREDERIVGTKGSAYATRQVGYLRDIKGKNIYKYDGPQTGGTREQHMALVQSIRDGKPINEGKSVAESTMTAIMGRMSAYTGRALKWDWVMEASTLDMRPPEYKLGDLPVQPVAVPGKTPLI
jgi:predicted dehydrogenase